MSKKSYENSPKPQNLIKSPLFKKNRDQAYVKSSFFDETDIQTPEQRQDEYCQQQTLLSKFWLTETEFYKYMPYMQKGKVLYESEIIILNKYEKEKERYLEVYQEYIICYQNADKLGKKKFLPYKCTKVEFYENISKEQAKILGFDEKYDNCLFLTRNKGYKIMVATSEYQFKQWESILKNKLILSQFIKKYQTIKLIGKGTFAKVALCINFSNNKEYAVKIFEKKALIESDQPNRTKISLINEIEIMRQLDQENIIHLYEVYEGQNNVYLVMDLLKGGEIFDNLLDNQLQTEKNLYYVNYKIQDLEEKGIMHRDIKPENLIIQNSINMKVFIQIKLVLVDFGLADHIDNQNKIFTRCGTPGYVAPEILNDEPYDCKVDMFSAGIIFYIMLTGCSVFNGKSQSQIIEQNRKCTINWKFEKIGIHLSESCIKYYQGMSLLKGLLEIDPNKRLSIRQAINHPWIQQFYMNISEESFDSYENQINSQENRKKYQQELNFKFQTKYNNKQIKTSS